VLYPHSHPGNPTAVPRVQPHIASNMSSSAPNFSAASSAPTTQASADTNYKKQLDEIASKVKNGPVKEVEEKGNSVIGKVTETVNGYVATLGNAVGIETYATRKQQEAEVPVTETRPLGPPERPDHDVQIAEFIRDQHRSEKLALGEGKRD